MIEPERLAAVDEFAQFLSDMADKYEMTVDDYTDIFRHIGKCFGGIVVTDDGAVKEKQT